MSAVSDFLSLFDEQGCYKNGDGEVGVIFLTQAGTQYPGTLRFKSGLLVSAQMDGTSPSYRPDAPPLGSSKFLLDFPGEGPRAVFVDQGRIVHIFEMNDRATKDQFLANIRVARNLFFHPSAHTGSQPIDTASISDTLTRGAVWLTARSVEGFNAADFPELRAARQAELQNAVQAFTAVASQVPADKPPTREQYGNAATAFMAILNILSPYIPTADEARKVEQALRKVTFPPWVVNWDFELRGDEEADAAVRVNVFAEGDVAQTDYGRFGSQIIPMIRQALEAEGVQRWPYIKLRTVTEYKSA